MLNFMDQPLCIHTANVYDRLVLHLHTVSQRTCSIMSGEILTDKIHQTNPLEAANRSLSSIQFATKNSNRYLWKTDLLVFKFLYRKAWLTVWKGYWLHGKKKDTFNVNKNSCTVTKRVSFHFLSFVCVYLAIRQWNNSYYIWMRSKHLVKSSFFSIWTIRICSYRRTSWKRCKVNLTI